MLVFIAQVLSSSEPGGGCFSWGPGGPQRHWKSQFPLSVFFLPVTSQNVQWLLSLMQKRRAKKQGGDYSCVRGGSWRKRWASHSLWPCPTCCCPSSKKEREQSSFDMYPWSFPNKPEAGTINIPEMGFSQDPQLGDQKEFAVHGVSICSAFCSFFFQLFECKFEMFRLWQNSYFSQYESNYFWIGEWS